MDLAPELTPRDCESHHHRCSDPAGSTVEFTGRYQSIPDTLVQLFGFSTSGLIAYRDAQHATWDLRGVPMNDLEDLNRRSNAGVEMDGECHD